MSKIDQAQRLFGNVAPPDGSEYWRATTPYSTAGGANKSTVTIAAAITNPTDFVTYTMPGSCDGKLTRISFWAEPSSGLTSGIQFYIKKSNGVYPQFQNITVPTSPFSCGLWIDFAIPIYHGETISLAATNATAGAIEVWGWLEGWQEVAAANKPSGRR